MPGKKHGIHNIHVKLEVCSYKRRHIFAEPLSREQLHVKVKTFHLGKIVVTEINSVTRLEMNLCRHEVHFDLNTLIDQIES